LFTLRGGTGTGGEAHRSPHAQEQLRANVQPARSQGYQQQGRVSEMNEIWYVDEGEGFHLVAHVFETKIEAERYARELFPEESQDLRHARIYCKEVVSFKEV
jgi:hypothetical protein